MPRMALRGSHLGSGLKGLGVAAALIVGAFGYTRVMARLGSGEPPPLVPVEQRAERIRLLKSERRLELWRGDTLLRSYRVSLGSDADGGPKLREGDERTPEGRYRIDWRNPRSMAHLSLHISYPSEADAERARLAGVPPGGDIMIHGLPNGWGWLAPLHHLWDWTNGCIGVTNAEMQEIWSLVPTGTPVELGG